MEWRWSWELSWSLAINPTPTPKNIYVIVYKIATADHTIQSQIRTEFRMHDEELTNNISRV